MNASSHTALDSRCFFNLSGYTPALLLHLKFFVDFFVSEKKISFIILLKWDRDNASRVCQLSDVEILVRIKGRAQSWRKDKNYHLIMS